MHGIRSGMLLALGVLALGLAGCGPSERGGDEPATPPGQASSASSEHGGTGGDVASSATGSMGGAGGGTSAPAAEGEKKEGGESSESGDKGGAGKGDAKHPHVVLNTSMGDIELELDAEKAPISTANFLKYVKKGFYDGTIFHRVIPGFMVQGGGMKPDMSEKPTEAPIKNEGQNGLHNERGTIAMARTQDLDSATAQFFISVADNTTKLDYPINGGYAVFGKVVKGMDVADKIVSVPTTSKGPHDDVPVDPILIKSAKAK